MNPGTATYVNSAASLAECIRHLETCTGLALDLEFDRERHAYGTTLCLVQVYAGGRCFLLDPLSGISLQGLFSLLEAPDVLKIMHSPGEDLQLLHQAGCFPKNIFDTERCARLLNAEAFSLSALLQGYMGVSLDKSQQKADWTARPLRPAQLEYAAKDVIFLPELKEILYEAARRKGILGWVAEENAWWDAYRAEEKPAGEYVNKEDRKKYSPYHLHLVNALMAVRDRYACSMNKPGYRVIGKDVLLDLAFKPERIAEWLSFREVHPRLKHAAVQQELQTALEQAAREAREQNLSRRSPTRLDYEERQQLSTEKHRLKALADQQLKPLLTLLTERYGAHTVQYMYSDKTQLELVAGNLGIEMLPFRYRSELLVSAARELGRTLSL